MKILFVTESYWPNADGGALFERRLVLGLAGLGHKLEVWAPGPRFESFDEADGPSTIHRERSIPFIFNTKYRASLFPVFKARQVIRKFKPELLHIHNFGWMGLWAEFWARHYHIPLVATNHFMPENALLNVKYPKSLDKPLAKLIWNYLVWLHNRANFVTSPTPTAIELIRNHGLTAPSKAISNGIDLDVFKPGLDASSVIAKYKLATDKPIALYVGRLDGEKRLDLIISAWVDVLKSQPVQLVMAGYGKEMDRLKAQARSLGVADHVVFTGYIDEADKPLLYNAAAVFVISSPAELQSIVTLEAMASGLPVVAVDVAALKELCQDGRNGLLFPRDDIPALTDRLNRLLKDPQLRGAFGRESLKIVTGSHSTSVTFHEYEAIYQAVLQTRKAIA